MIRRLFFIAAAVLLVASTTFAHHSFGATYETGKSIKLDGTIVQFVYRNPHSFVHIEAPDESGTMQRWAVEWGGAGQLGNTGVTRESLKAGDLVVITGAPGRNPADHRIRMVTLKRPRDGFTWGQAPGQTVD